MHTSAEKARLESQYKAYVADVGHLFRIHCDRRVSFFNWSRIHKLGNTTQDFDGLEWF